MVNITLPDGAQKSFDNAVSGVEIAKSISPKLAKQAVAITYNDEIKDLNYTVETDGNVSIITKDDEKALEVIRHSTAHLLANAVQNLWKGTQVTIGPVIKDGFYYDFDFPEGVKISDADLPKIEKEMRKILKKVQPFQEELLRVMKLFLHLRKWVSTLKLKLSKESMQMLQFQFMT